MEGSISLVCNSAFGNLWLIYYLKTFQDQHPKITIHFRTSELEEHLEADQVLGKTDFSIVTQKPPVRESLNDVLACKYPFRFFASEAYLQKHGTPTCFKDLRHHKLMTCSESMRLRVQNSKLSPGFLEVDEEMASIAKEKPMVVDNGLNALFAVKKGMGIALLPLFYQEMIEPIHLEDEKEKIGHLKSQKHIVYSKALEGSKRHEVFLEYLKGEMKTLS